MQERHCHRGPCWVRQVSPGGSVGCTPVPRELSCWPGAHYSTLSIVSAVSKARNMATCSGPKRSADGRVRIPAPFSSLTWTSLTLWRDVVAQGAQLLARCNSAHLLLLHLSQHRAVASSCAPIMWPHRGVWIASQHTAFCCAEHQSKYRVLAVMKPCCVGEMHRL